MFTLVQSALRRYVEDEQKKREAANDAWVFSSASGKWEPVKYASGDVPRVRLTLYQHNAAMLVHKHKDSALECYTHRQALPLTFRASGAGISFSSQNSRRA